MNIDTSKWKFPIEHLGSLIPIVSILAIIASLIFTNGYLFIFGKDWASTLTVKDLLTRTWTMLPIIAGISYVLFIFTPIFEGWSSTTARIIVDATNRTRNTVVNKLLYIAIVASSLGALIFSIGQFKYIRQDSYFIFGQSVLLFYILNTLSIIVLIFTNRPQPMIIAVYGFMIYATLLIFFFAGCLTGMKAKLNTSNTLVHYGSHQFCGKYIMNTERGLLLYNPNVNTVRLIPWSDIKLVDRPVQCRLQEAWRRPRPPAKKHPQPAASS